MARTSLHSVIMREAAVCSRMKPKSMVWKEFNGGNWAERSDGVTAEFRMGHSEFPYVVSRGRGKKFEWLAGKMKAVRAFKTLESAMKAADKAWPLIAA